MFRIIPMSFGCQCRKPTPRRTDVILYNVRTFHATHVLALSDLHITSDAMVVDNDENAIYMAACGDLLKIPLPAEHKLRAP